jgi:hypothetical protein
MAMPRAVAPVAAPVDCRVRRVLERESARKEWFSKRRDMVEPAFGQIKANGAVEACRVNAPWVTH